MLRRPLLWRTALGRKAATLLPPPEARFGGVQPEMSISLVSCEAVMLFSVNVGSLFVCASYMTAGSQLATWFVPCFRLLVSSRMYSSTCFEPQNYHCIQITNLQSPDHE